MYCRKCGTDLKDKKFCTKCGFNNSPDPVVEETKQPTEPKKSSKPAVAVVLIVVIIFIVAVISIIAVVFIFAFKTVTSIATNDFIELDKLKVPSIYKVTGEKYSICGYSFSNGDDEGKMSIEYCGEISDDDLEEYVDYLIEESGFSLYEGPYKYNLRKEEDGFVIYVLISDNGRVTYSYVRGSFNMVNERIGV